MPRIEVLPPDELPHPLPVLVAPPSEPLNFTPTGQIADSATAKLLGARGGHAKANKKRLLQGLGLADLNDQDAFLPYWRAVNDWVEAQLAVTAGMCGGSIGPGPASIIGTAGVQLAASRYFSDIGMKTGNPKMFAEASKLGDASRQNLLAAYELGRREGEVRKDVNPYDAFKDALEDKS